MQAITIAVEDPAHPTAPMDQFAWQLPASALSAGTVEDDIAELVVSRVIDSVAAGVAGLTVPTAARARSVAWGNPLPSGATLLGAASDTRVAAGWAAYANTTAIRYLDWSDTFGGTDFSHPSDVIAPMVAVAQQTGRSGADLIRGVVHAYQAMIALTSSIPLHAYGIDQFANLGAAMPTGLAALLDLSPEVAYQAVGLSAYLSATTYQVRTGDISSWKANGPGFVAKTAIDAVDHAMRGEDAPSPVYEGPYGELAVLLGGKDATFDVPLLEPGEAPRLIEQSFPKQWPAEYMAQPFIDMALRLRTTIPDLTAVEDILLTASRDMQEVIGSSVPERYSPDAPRGTLDHSLMYIMAVALEDGTVDFQQSFTPERAHRPETVALWKKIRTRADREWTAAVLAEDPAARKTGGEVDVTMADGTTYHDQMDNAAAYNYPTPWQRADYITKFHAVTDRFLADGEAERFLDLVQRLPELDSAALLGLYPRVRDDVVGDGGHGIY